MLADMAQEMYAHHVPHTFSSPIPKYKKSPEPCEIPGIFLCTPDWIRYPRPSELELIKRTDVRHKGLAIGHLQGYVAGL